MSAKLMLLLIFFLIGCNNAGNKTDANGKKDDASTQAHDEIPYQKLIIKHWISVEMLGKNHVPFQRALTKARAKGIYNTGMEFTEDGKCYLYEDGALARRAEYFIASDGKSLLISEPGSSYKESLKIVSLTSNKALFALDKRDTLVMEPYKSK